MSWTVTPSPNCGSQLERAVIAYLYESWNTAVIGRPAFHFSKDALPRSSVPLVDVLAFRAAESPEFTRNEQYSLRIEAVGEGVTQAGQADSYANWVEMDKLIGLPMAAMSVRQVGGQGFDVTARRISAAGRRLAVTGINHILGDNCDAADDLTNNEDMATFVCDAVQYVGAERAQSGESGLVLVEQRNFTVNCANYADNSVFPALAFDGTDTLSWVYTGGTPTFWVLEKSADGLTWAQHGAAIAGGTTTKDISGTGENYWRVWISPDGTELVDPESNAVLVTA